MRISLALALPFAICVLCVAAAPAQAAMLRGQDLSSQCENSTELCTGYIFGVADQWGGIEAHLDQAKKCFPEGISTGILVETVRSYMAAHPEKSGLAAPEVVVAAFEDALDC